jgi:hypothetical protein
MECDVEKIMYRIDITFYNYGQICKAIDRFMNETIQSLYDDEMKNIMCNMRTGNTHDARFMLNTKQKLDGIDFPLTIFETELIKVYITQPGITRLLKYMVFKSFKDELFDDLSLLEKLIIVLDLE